MNGTSMAGLSPRGLDRALAHSRFNCCEQVLLVLAREQLAAAEDDGPMEGRATRCPLRLDIDDLAKRTGLAGRKLRAALESLIVSRVLTRRHDRGLRLNADIARWVDPATGRHRLRGKILAFCLSPDVACWSIGDPRP